MRPSCSFGYWPRRTGQPLSPSAPNQGAGKSTFLELLEELARTDGGAAVCRYPLTADRALMSLTDFVHGRLVARDPELSNDSRYAALKSALRSADHKAFGFPLPQPITVQSTVTLTGTDVESGGFVNGVQIAGQWGPGTRRGGA